MAQTSNLTILLTDIKGFTEKTSHRSRADILALLEKHRELVLPVLTSRGGRLVKTIGDAFLMTFESPTDGVLAGVAVQDALRAYNEDKNLEDRIEVRIAINSGEVTLAENDVFGDPVNIASRIEGVAEAGEVFFTEAVYLAMNKNEVPSSEIGLLQLKGIPEKIRVYKVRRENPVGQNSAESKSTPIGGRAPAPKAVTVAAAAQETSSAGKPAPIKKRAAALAIDLILCSILVNLFWPSGYSRRRRRDDAAAKTAVTQAVAEAAKAAAHGSIKIDDKGVSIDGKVAKLRLDDNGVLLQQGDKGAQRELRIDDNGVSVKGPSGQKTIVDAGRDSDEDDDGGRRWAWAWPLTWFIYSLVFLKRMRTTPGGRIMSIHVERVDGAPLDKKDRLYRAAFSVVSAYCLGIGFVWALFNKERSGWHDLFACTRVVDGC